MKTNVSDFFLTVFCLSLSDRDVTDIKNVFIRQVFVDFDYRDEKLFRDFFFKLWTPVLSTIDYFEFSDLFYDLTAMSYVACRELLDEDECI